MLVLDRPHAGGLQLLVADEFRVVVVVVASTHVAEQVVSLAGRLLDAKIA